MKNEIELQTLSPNLIVDDVNLAVNYYTANLGFVLIASVPETGNYNWAMVQQNGIALMFQSLASIREDMPELNIGEKGCSGTLFIKMKGIDTLYSLVKSKVDIAMDMRTTFYGMKEFVVRDLNGYFLTFAEDI